ncbi:MULTISPECIES: SigE family RNA polymerase sigma factor [Dactylosporangium]|uniref:RNA polymerase n=2 Tax=Dactylosporangium TaxID=35753 RepID=A0A9W6KXM5_9ACTN|nr:MULTISPECIES: SigE family RNA polymerase sigma factor [Dactylosporangium]UAB94488.1 SigE family RNA polymerase sigma factor [Dactylosporangium vinaceum]UWZ42861.1 SigE family RNA polymerase sigma factor [Dactylosporangium matsuzakiense]GLL07329.1 RNA polymerase [Dactylosporangium matsuzakiense]
MGSDLAPAGAATRRPEGFDDFVRSRGGALLRFAYVLCGDAHLAEDIVQEVLARMHPRWARVTVMDSPEAYVRTAVVRQFLSWRRRRSAGEAVVAEVPEPPGFEEPQQRVLARDQMWQLLAGLPRAQRAVLVLRFYCDLPDADIAALLDCRETTVRSQAARALARMRTMLGEVRGDG